MLTPIGHLLKAAREKRGLSLLDASHQTRIPVARLHMLEQDNYAAFGSMTYARSFLRRYSQFLEVDVQEILEQLPGGVLGGPRDYRYLTENHGLWVAPRGVKLGHLSAATGKGHTRRSPVPAGIFIFVLALAGTGIWGKYVAEDRQAQQKQAESAPALPPAAPEPLSARAISPPVVDSIKILKAIPLSDEERSKAQAGNARQVE